MTQNIYDKAFEIAQKTHHGQKDRGGQDYINYPLRIAESFIDPSMKAVAILHDVVEDSDTTFEDLEAAGFEPKIIDALKVLTKFPGETKRANAERIVQSKALMALSVKLVDLTDNMRLDSLKEITEEDTKRWLEYLSVRSYLIEHSKKSQFV